MSDKKCNYQYTVRRGDSFYLIAHRLGVPLRDLLEANSSINPARLTVGDVLCIPTVNEEQTAEPPAVQQPAADPVPAPVPDSMPEQASPPADDAPARQTPMPDDEPADLLDHPASGEDAPEDTPPAAQSPAADQPSGDAPADDTAYTVARSETLADIQLAANVNLHTLEVANPDTDLTALAEGQVLHVPKENIPCPVMPTCVLRPGDTLESTALRLNVSVGALLRANPCMAPGDFVPGACVWVPQV